MAKPPVKASPNALAFLREILADTNHWLQYAEAKNGAILAIAAALAAAQIESFLDPKDWPGASFYLGIAGIVSFLLTVITSASSFLPQLSQKSSVGANPHINNILYFRSAAEWGAEGFLKALRERRIEIEPGDEELAKDFANQICANARIALRKFTIFDTCTRIFLVGLCFVGASIIVRAL